MLTVNNVKLAIRNCGLEEDKKGRLFLKINGLITNGSRKKCPKDIPSYVVDNNMFAKGSIYGREEDLRKLLDLFTDFRQIYDGMLFTFRLDSDLPVYLRWYYLNQQYIPCIYIFDYHFDPKKFTNMIRKKAPQLLDKLKLSKEELESKDISEEDFEDDLFDDIEKELSKTKVNQQARKKSRSVKDEILENALK